MKKESELTVIKLQYKVPKEKFEQFSEYLASIKKLLEKPMPSKLFSSNVVSSDNKICPSHKPLFLRYIEWHEEAERRHRKGMKQKQCEVCKRWLWKDEI